MPLRNIFVIYHAVENEMNGKDKEIKFKNRGQNDICKPT